MQDVLYLHAHGNPSVPEASTGESEIFRFSFLGLSLIQNICSLHPKPILK